MVSWAIAEEARDLIKKRPSQQNQRPPESSQRSPQQDCRPGTSCDLPDPAWRDLGATRTKGREEWGRGTDPASFRKVCWQSGGIWRRPEVSKCPVPCLGSCTPIPTGTRSRENKAGQTRTSPGLSEARWSPVPPSSQVCGPGCPLLDTGESAGVLI